VLILKVFKGLFTDSLFDKMGLLNNKIFLEELIFSGSLQILDNNLDQQTNLSDFMVTLLKGRLVYVQAG